MAVFQSTSVVGGSISLKTMSTIPSRSSLLVGDVVVERHRARAELVGELAHRQRLDPVAIGERDGGLAARAPCSAALAARWLVSVWSSAVRFTPLAASYSVRVGCLRTAYETPTEEPQMQSRNLAARAGRWSAQHRKTAILGWIVFVVLATVLGGKVGQNDIDESARGSGESKRGDMIVEAAGLPRPGRRAGARAGQGLDQGRRSSGHRRREGRREPPGGDPGHHRDREPARTRPTASTPSPRTAARSS